MKSEAFEKECQDKILGHVWDETFNESYQESITLTIREMRFIVNALRAFEKKTYLIPRAFDPDKE